VRQSRAGIELARIPQIFKHDSRHFVKGTVPGCELNNCAAQRYNFISPRPRVVFFHLFLRGSRAAFFLPVKSHFNLVCATKRCIAKAARIKILARVWRFNAEVISIRTHEGAASGVRREAR
jgi:hypothetical protein